MSKALDPLRRLVVQFNARFAQLRAIPTTSIPPPAPPHLHHAPASHAVPFTKPLPVFGQFQVKVAYPSHKDGPVLLAHLNQQFHNIARSLFVPEPARVAAVDYACRSAGRPQMASLLSATSQRAMHHRPLAFAVPHGFVKNVGFFSSRSFSSGTTAFHPALNGPVKMMAQMYAKPLGFLPANAQKLSEKERPHQYQVKKVSHQQRNKSHRGGEVKKRSAAYRVSSSTIKAFMSRAAAVERQHQILTVCNANVPITEATAISLAKVAGKTVSEMEELPKLTASESCPTNVDMIFLLDASPLWHLDTMVSALHTDSLRVPKELNMKFIEDLLEITNAQYQHFLEVSAVLQKLVQCPESKDITLEGYELRVHFVGTTLFDMSRFLQQLTIDPRCPHFELEEIYVDSAMAREQYYPQASVHEYYAPSISDNETWEGCSSLNSSIMLYADSERNSSVASFATMDSMPVQQSPWEGVQTKPVQQDQVKMHDYQVPQQEQVLEQAEQQSSVQDQIVDVVVADMTVVPNMTTVASTGLLLSSEEAISPWQESTENLDKMSSRILSSTVVTEEYFDNIRGFLDSIEAVHRHSEKLFCSPSSPSTPL
ncbi:hypothetical protein EDD11_000561 [Mortierella claussenii]|nr:hypothetical protein EDD11_000561 [Mortierella claussenii]